MPVLPNSLPEKLDAVICGGGPAGATAAIVLARAGHKVALFEREHFPRFHIGESLLPENVPLFARLGVLQKIESAGFQKKFGARFYHQGTERKRLVRFARSIDSSRPLAFQVKRAEFDKLMLDHARECGAMVFEGARVEDALWEGGTATGVRVRLEGEAAPREIPAAVVFDATGRDALFSRKLGGRTRDPRLDRSSAFAHYDRFERAEGPEAGDIIILTTPDGWWWLIPLSDGSVSVGVVMPSKRFKERSGSVTDLFESSLAATPEVAALLGGAKRTTDVHAIADYSYRTAETHGDGFCLLGDAACFLDPVFSSGVLLAMVSAELQASAAARALSKRGAVTRRDFSPGDKVMRRGIGKFRKYVHGFYEPPLLETFYTKAPNEWIERGVTYVLAGGVFFPSLRARLLDAVFHGFVRLTAFRQRRNGCGEFARAAGH